MDKIKTLLKEPLFQFLLIGAGLFLLFGWKNGPASQMGGQLASETGKIIVSRSDVDQLVATFARTWQRSPTDEEVKELIESFVRDEIYYREAVAIGLDRDDGVIRRRLRLKMEYIFENISSQVEPTDEELQAYLKNNADSYLEDPQISFRQIYINADERGKNAEPYARHLLTELEKGVDPGTIGDLFLKETEVRLLFLWDIKHQYGERFVEGILEIEPGRWQGPIRSAYGLHLVFVSELVPQRLPELSQVSEQVRRDWAVDRQKKLKDAAYVRLKERYAIIVEQPKTATAPAVAEAGPKTVVR